MRAVLLLALASCWRGKVAEPSETPAPPVSAWPAKGITKPNTGPPLTSFSPGPLTLGHAAWDDEAGCLECHVTVGSKAPLDPQRCLGCHDHDDIRARIAMRRGLHASPPFRVECQLCHREHKGRSYDHLGWQSVPGGAARFDHALTGWPLPAAYQQWSCGQCHQRRNSAGHTLYVGLDRAQFP